MKKISSLLLVVICNFVTIIKAQDTIYFNSSGLNLEVISTEITSLNGNFEIGVEVIFSDTTVFNNNFIVESEKDYITYILPSSQPDSALYFPGDTNILSFSFSYDTSAIPFFPFHVSISYLNNSESTEHNTIASAFMYFTP